MKVDVIAPDSQGAAKVDGLTPVQAGQLVYADGVNWNPGQGKGWYWWDGVQFSKFARQTYRSPEQTITAAGTLTLTHGFVGVLDPALVKVAVYLICKTAEAGYSVGDIVGYPDAFYADTWAQQIGPSWTVTATAIRVQFGSGPNVAIIPNKTTGVGAAVTAANWKAIFVAEH